MDDKEREREERLTKLTDGFRRRQALEKELELGQQKEGCGWLVMSLCVAGLLCQLIIVLIAIICK